MHAPWVKARWLAAAGTLAVAACSGSAAPPAQPAEAAPATNTGPAPAPAAPAPGTSWVTTTPPPPDPGPLPASADDPTPFTPDDALPYDPVVSGVAAAEQPCQDGWCWWNYPRGLKVADVFADRGGLGASALVWLNQDQYWVELTFDGARWAAPPMPWLPGTVLPAPRRGDWRGSYTDLQRFDGTAWQALPFPEVPGLANDAAVGPITVGPTWSADYDHGVAALAGFDRAQGTTALLGYDAGAWRAQVLPPGHRVGSLAGSAPDDVWASNADAFGPDETEVWRFDGTRWWAEPASLRGPVHVAARGDVWVGTQHLAGGRWTEPPGTPDVAWAGGPRDAWGVRPGTGSLVHWNGQAWTARAHLTGRLRLLGATGPDDAWAVAGTADGNSVLVRWDGRAWQTVAASFAPADLSGALEVSALSSTPDDVWVARRDGAWQWDGRGWTFHALPGLAPAVAPGTLDYAAVAMAGTGPSDMWVVSHAAYHWDGAAWTALGPFPGEVHALWSPRAGTVFALGYRGLPPTPADPSATKDASVAEVIWRWDGGAWSKVVVGDPASTGGYPGSRDPRGTTGAMSGARADDGWASLRATWRWDGVAWRRATASERIPAPLGMRCFWGTGPTDVWAFEAFAYPQSSGGTHHWDGAAWSEAPSPKMLRCGAGTWRAAEQGGLWRRSPP